MSPEPHFFASPSEFHEWLSAHSEIEPELLVGFWKLGSGHPSMTWPESVEVALCFGWIDGIRRRIDDLAYSIRFTPRRRTSNWSAVNIATAEELIAAGRMQPAGLAAFQAREDRRSKIYAYERPAPAALTPEESAAFQSHELAWSYFESCPAGYRRVILHWISSAKRQETRARRLGQLIQACHNRLRLRS